MEAIKMSPEARALKNKLSREYIKEYRKRNPNKEIEYWERKVQKMKEEQVTAEVSTQEHPTIEERIRSNEKLIKTLLSENKRLIKALEKSQLELKKLNEKLKTN